MAILAGFLKWDGKDGKAPVISVKSGSDGNYYWTADGEWILDGDGNKVKVDGSASAPKITVPAIAAGKRARITSNMNPRVDFVP